MINPTAKDIDRMVLYVAESNRCDAGRIADFDDDNVFVVFADTPVGTSERLLSRGSGLVFWKGSGAMSIDEEVKVAMERINQAMRDKGHEADSLHRASAFFGGERWIVTARRASGRDLDCFGDMLNEAVEGLLAKIADLPPRWTDEQVAATLGIGVAA